MLEPPSGEEKNTLVYAQHFQFDAFLSHAAGNKQIKWNIFACLFLYIREKRLMMKFLIHIYLNPENIARSNVALFHLDEAWQLSRDWCAFILRCS